jgi:hypothetical protein
MENKLFRTNTFKVVGRLLNTDVRTGTLKSNGQEYISIDVTVQSTIGGKNNEFEISLFANKLTKDGKPSQLYTSYSKLPELVNKKVEISGDIRENRYFSSNLNQIISTQQLNGRWVRGVADSSADEATYELGGFIVKSLVERQNKAGEVYRYDLTIAQSDYAGNGLSMYTLHVDPSRRDILAGVEGYNVGDTVRLNGSLNFTVETVTAASNNDGGFGEPVTRTYTNRQRSFFIEGGSAPIQDDTAYDNVTIKTLIDAYKANDVALTAKGSTSTSAAPAVEDAPVTRRQTSLI